MSLLDYLKIIASTIAILSGISAAILRFYRWSYNRGLRHADRVEKQLKYVYGPLYALFLDTGFCSSTGVMYPHLQVRAKRAIRFLGDHEYRKALGALFDRGIKSYGTEVEYGGTPSPKMVTEVIEKNIEIADHKLLSLYRAIRKEELRHFDYHVEKPSYAGPEISKNYEAFVDHVFEMRERLSKMLQKG